MKMFNKSFVHHYSPATAGLDFYLLSSIFYLRSASLIPLFMLLLLTSPALTQELTPSPKTIALQASRAYAQGQFSAAEKEYQRALAITPHNSEYLSHLAATELHLNKPKEAELHLRQSLQEQLENPFAWLHLGMIYLDQRRNEEAFAVLVQAALYDPKNAHVQHYLGIAAGRKHWNEVSEACLRKAVELDPNYADAQYNLAVYYLQRNPPATEIARRHYQRALDLGAPHDPTMDAALKQTKTEGHQ